MQRDADALDIYFFFFLSINWGVGALCYCMETLLPLTPPSPFHLTGGLDKVVDIW